MDMQDKYGDTATLLASKHGHVNCLKCIIHSGADVNIKNNQGEIGLILAVRHNHIECTDLLIKSGADVNITDDNGFTALNVAAPFRTRCLVFCVNVFVLAK